MDAGCRTTVCERSRPATGALFRADWDNHDSFGPRSRGRNEPLPQRIAQPREQPLERPAVDYPIGGNAGESRVGDCGLCIRQLAGGVRIAVEREETAWRRVPGPPACNRGPAATGSPSISIATPRSRRRGKHRVPPRDHARTRAGDPAARVGEDPDRRVLDGRHHAVCLVLVLSAAASAARPAPRRTCRPPRRSGPAGHRRRCWLRCPEAAGTARPHRALTSSMARRWSAASVHRHPAGDLQAV